MLSEYRQILHEKANFPALHTDISRVALNAFLRNYYFWILKTYQDVMHYDHYNAFSQKASSDFFKT